MNYIKVPLLKPVKDTISQLASFMQYLEICYWICISMYEIIFPAVSCVVTAFRGTN